MTLRKEPEMPSRGDTRLVCRACGAGTKLVSRTQQMLKVKGKKRLHAAVECSNCHRESWSRHPEAVRISKMLDAAAKAEAEL